MAKATDKQPKPPKAPAAKATDKQPKTATPATAPATTGDDALPEWDCSCGNLPKRRVSAADPGEARARYGEVLGIWSFPSEPAVVPAADPVDEGGEGSSETPAADGGEPTAPPSPLSPPAPPAPPVPPAPPAGS